jgi:hypothetical protein
LLIDPRLDLFRGLDVEASGRIDRDPAPEHFLVSPSCRHLGINPAENVKVIVQYREATDRYRKRTGKVLEPHFDPDFAMFKPSATQRCLTHAS